MRDDKESNEQCGDTIWLDDLHVGFRCKLPKGHEGRHESNIQWDHEGNETVHHVRRSR